ncbi:MAG: rRNA maturation RNase YbeY [Elusimicrobia bacterium]|nr:rRNA maturation RNase YbeY [Elusimicrobiota bacterium]
MKILFAARGTPPAGVENLARRAVRRVFAGRRPVPRGEMNIVWTTREDLRRMNRRFRRTDRFTDVIAFRHGPSGVMGEFPLGPRGDEPFGDLYIAVDQARVNARRFGVSPAEELVRLVVHGSLHLLGYTDYEPAEKARMWAAQEPIVQCVVKNASV